MSSYAESDADDNKPTELPDFGLRDKTLLLFTFTLHLFTFTLPYLCRGDEAETMDAGCLQELPEEVHVPSLPTAGD
jgi:hypothetical protein